MSALIYYTIPFFLLTVALEWLLSRRRGDAVVGYHLKDTFASLTMGIGNVIISAAFRGVVAFMFLALYEYRLFDVPNVWWAWVLLFLGDDFCYYWFHRASHEVRFLWAAHVNHHSSTHYNLSTALRQSWTTPFTAPVFWLPLALVGFTPEMILVQQAISLVYQYWLHTELIGRLGPLEWIFNTPSHHRVHHGRNPEYIDRNHAGILIVWDRLFGTFEPERHPVDYGLTVNLDSHNPIRIAFHDWQAMIRDVRHARTWRGRLGYIFGPPGWREDGTGKTAKAMRRDAKKRRLRDDSRPPASSGSVAA